MTNREKITMPNAYDIVESPAYVIIGTRGSSRMHGSEIPPEAIQKLIDSLENAEALMMEGEEAMFRLFHPLSTETLAKAAMQGKPVKYLPESKEGHELGYYLLQYGLPEETVELSVPSMRLRRRINESSEQFLLGLPLLFESHKNIFSSINTERGVSNFLKVIKYWSDNQLNLILLEDFAYDFEKFMSHVREYEFWGPELTDFRGSYEGKIGVSCGSYHTDFVESVLEGKPYERPQTWETYLDTTADQLRDTYTHLTKAINPSDSSHSH